MMKLAISFFSSTITKLLINGISVKQPYLGFRNQLKTKFIKSLNYVVFHKIILDMEYEDMIQMIKEEDAEIIVIAELLSEMDDKVIRLYKRYKLIKLLWEKNYQNEEIKSHLDNIYWQLTKEVNIHRKMLRIWGYHELSITNELQVSNDLN